MEEMTEETKKKKTCWKCGREVEQQVYATLDYIPRCVCGALYPEKPALEAKLSIYQNEYLEKRTQESFNKLFSPLYDLVFNILYSKLKSSSKLPSREKIEDMAQWSLMKLASYYRTKPDFKISGSFTSYISKVVLYPIYNKKDKKKEKKEISIYTPLSNSEDDKNKTLMDKVSEESVETSFEANSLNRLSQDRIIENTTGFIRKALNIFYNYQTEKNPKKSFYKLVELSCLYRHYINKKGERYYREVNRTCSPEIMESFTKSLEVVKAYLRNGAE